MNGIRLTSIRQFDNVLGTFRIVGSSRNWLGDRTTSFRGMRHGEGKLSNADLPGSDLDIGTIDTLTLAGSLISNERTVILGVLRLLGFVLAFRRRRRSVSITSRLQQ